MPQTLDAAVVARNRSAGEGSGPGNIGLRDVQAKTVLSPARLEGLNADLAITPDVGHITNLSTTVVVPAIVIRSAKDGSPAVASPGR